MFRKGLSVVQSSSSCCLCVMELSRDNTLDGRKPAKRRNEFCCTVWIQHNRLVVWVHDMTYSFLLKKNCG